MDSEWFEPVLFIALVSLEVWLPLASMASLWIVNSLLTIAMPLLQAICALMVSILPQDTFQERFRVPVLIERPNLSRIRENEERRRLSGRRRAAREEAVQTGLAQAAAALQPHVTQTLERHEPAERPLSASPFLAPPLTVRSTGARCPVCSDLFVQRPLECVRCSAPHHLECWEYNRGCAIFGCDLDRA